MYIHTYVHAYMHNVQIHIQIKLTRKDNSFSLVLRLAVLIKWSDK